MAYVHVAHDCHIGNDTIFGEGTEDDLSGGSGDDTANVAVPSVRLNSMRSALIRPSRASIPAKGSPSTSSITTYGTRSPRRFVASP